MPRVISDMAEWTQSRLGERVPEEGDAGNDPFFIGLRLKLSATISGGFVQTGRRQLPSGLQQHQEGDL